MRDCGPDYRVARARWRLGSGSERSVLDVPAGEMDSAVIDQLRAVFRQPEIVVGTWRAARDQDDGITEAEVRDALLQLDPLSDELFPAEQARMIQLLVRRVTVTADGLAVDIRAEGISGVIRDMLSPSHMEAAQ